MDAFDKHIKTVFENHETPVDTATLWNRVEPALKKKRRPLPGFFFWVAGAGILILAGVWFIPNQRPDHTQAMDSSTAGQSQFGRKSQLYTNISDPDSQKTGKAYLPGTSWNPTGTRPEKQFANQPFKTEKKQFSIPNQVVKDNDEKAESRVTSFSSESFDVRPGIILSIKKVATNTVIQPVIAPLVTPVTIDEPVHFFKKPFRFGFDVFGGTDYTVKFLSEKNYDYRWYKEERLATENFLESFQLGTMINLTHQSGLMIRTGMIYRQIDEVFENNNTLYTTTFRDGVIEIITHADGSSTQVTGKKLVLEKKSWDKKIYNSYRFINVPIQLGYSFHYGLWQVEANAGIELNLALKPSGEILGKEGFPVSLSDAQNSIYRNQGSLSLTGGMRLLYPLSTHWAVFVEPNVQYDLNSITHTDYPLEHRYLNSGLRLGARLMW